MYNNISYLVGPDILKKYLVSLLLLTFEFTDLLFSFLVQLLHAVHQSHNLVGQLVSRVMG